MESAAPDFCFVHAADLHLGSRLWLARAPDDPRLSEIVAAADRLALRALVDTCLETGARFLFCSGDVFDGWCRDFRVALRLADEFRRLEGSDCQVVLLLGNHDVRQRMLAALLLPSYARVIGLRGPETLVFEEVGVAVHGWSAPELAPNDDAAARYPEPLPGFFNVGLLHTSAEGVRGHVDYAPCSRLGMRRKGYDYWALGHVHTREVVWRDPYIVFPGNLQGRGAREPGARGACVVQVSGGRVESLVFRSLEAVRFETCLVDAAGARSFAVLVERAASAVSACARDRARPCIVDLVFEGVEGVELAMSSDKERRRLALGSTHGAASGEDVQALRWIQRASFRASELGVELAA